jgi:hypothetical protein
VEEMEGEEAESISAEVGEPGILTNFNAVE